MGSGMMQDVTVVWVTFANVLSQLHKVSTAVNFPLADVINTDVFFGNFLNAYP